MLLNNRYQLHDKLGSGGMGAVFRAVDRLTGQAVALKRVRLLQDDEAINEELLLNISREFRTLASLRHPNIISVIDYGFDAEQQPYFTMDLLQSPKTLTQAAHPLDQARQIGLLVDTLWGLTYVHRWGIVHRDLKPDNVLVTQDGRVKVLDFGIAYERAPRHTTQIEAGLAGTMAYMAPELLMDELPSVESDLYAIGVIAYEIFSGRHPFNLNNTGYLLFDIMSRPPDLTLVPEQLRPVIGRLLAKEPIERYTSAEAVIEAFCLAVDLPIPSESLEIRESFLRASAFVGRERELNQLRDGLEAAIDGHGTAWLIGGESGVGKSRLLTEIRTRSLIRGALVLSGQAVAEGGFPYQLWREPIRRLALSTPLSDLEASILRDIVPDLETLIGREITPAPPLEAEAARQRLILTITDLFKRQTEPLVLLLEDLQWSNESLEPLKQLLLFIDQFAWLIIATYRDDEQPDLPAQLTEMQRMRLGRLSDDEMSQLSTAMLGDSGKRSDVLELLKRETEGNALFMVEVVRTLAEESGTLAAIGEITLPDHVFAGGIQQILQRRLERVPAWAQDLLQLAAVFGRQVELKLLQGAITDRSIAWETWLTLCLNATILEVSEGEWRFTHEKLRESILKNLTPQAVITLHTQAAQAIERLYRDDLTYAERLAYHWGQAQNASKALPYAVQAAEYLINISANYARADELLKRAERLAQQDGETAPLLPKLSQLLGDTSERLGNYPEAQRRYQQSLTLSIDHPTLTVHNLNGLSRVAFMQGDQNTAIDYAQQARATAQQHGDQVGLARSLSSLGTIALNQRAISEAQAYYEQSLALYQQAEYQRGIAGSLYAIGMTASYQGDMERAAHYYGQSLALYRGSGDREGIASSLSGLAGTAYFQGALDDAERYYLETLHTFREIGDRARVAAILSELGFIAVRRESDQASVYFRESVQISRMIGNRSQTAALIVATCGSVIWEADVLQEAVRYFEENRVADQRSVSQAWTLSYLTLAKIAAFDFVEGRKLMIATLHLAQEVASLPVQLSAILDAAQLALNQEQWERCANLIGVIQAHPSETYDLKFEHVTAILRALKWQMNIDVLEQALAAGKQRPVNAVIAEILASASA
ncbi:MAG: protein kinase [Anaerolineae bacterium]|jgi:tetratricopeptide (TPR) repeat protein/tRNA A-37 threonylcarbamoyl transferase component Bud32|nr:protein kinase [Anaerolineae bacterium]